VAGSIYTYVGNTSPTSGTAAIEVSQGTVPIGQSGFFLPLEVADAEGEGCILVLGPYQSPASQLVAPLVGTTGSGVLTGLYRYLITFVTAAGETIAGPESAQASLFAQQGSISGIPVGSSLSGVLARKIYRTAANGASGTERYVATLSDNATTTYVDNTPDGSLGALAPISDLSFVPVNLSAFIFQHQPSGEYPLSSSGANYAQLGTDGTVGGPGGSPVNSSVGGGGGGGAQDAIPTAVVSGAQAVSAGQQVRLDISSVSAPCTLPTAPPNKTRCGIKVVKVSGTPGSTSATLTCGGSDVFNLPGGSTVLTFTASNQGAIVEYLAADATWTVQTTDTPLNTALGAAKLGTDGTVGGPSGSALTASAVSVSSRTGLQSVGPSANGTYGAAGALLNWAERRLWIPPVNIVAFRLRWSNYSAQLETGSLGAGTAEMVQYAVGFDPVLTAGRYTGAAVAAQTLVDSNESIPVLSGLGDHYISPWYTCTGAQGKRGTPIVLSLGVTGDSNSRFGYTPQGGRWSNGASPARSAQADLATITSLGYNTVAMGDWRVEYLYNTAQEPTAPSQVLVLGDSIAHGYVNNSTGYTNFCDSHESWSGAAAQRHRFSVMNGGLTSSTAANGLGGSGPWDPTVSGVPAQWRWQRLGIAATYTNAPVLTYDKAIVALGSNDASSASGTAANIETALQSIVTYLRATGLIPDVYLGTIIPRAFNGPKEAVRVAVNNWMRGYQGTAMPGITGVFDFDKAVTLGPQQVQTTTTLTSGQGTTGTPITVASGTGIAVGDLVTVVGGSTGTLPANTTVTVVSGTTVTLSANASGSGAATLMFSASSNSLADPDLVWDYPHPDYPGHQKMAAAVALK
jgi:lysophospholipase L1-like esterase